MPHYQLIFEGHIQEGHHPDEVRQNLAELFGVSADEIRKLFENTPVILKDGLDEDTARQDKAAFEKTGALCRMEAQARSAASGEPSADAPSAASTAEQDAAFADQPAASPPAAGRRYDLRHPYWLSFFYRPFYQDVALHWRGLAFVHLLILLALTGVVFIFHFQTLARAFINDQAPAILAQVPPITIKQGNVQVAVEQPFQIFRNDGRDLFAVIDTTGKITSLRQTDAMLLLTRSRLMARIGSGDSRVIDLSPIDELYLTRDDIGQWLQTSMSWAPIVLYPLTVFFTYCLRTVQVLIYAVIGMALATLLRRRIAFGAASSVAVMAMTPVIMVDTLAMLLKIELPLWGLGSFIVALVYLCYGIRAAAAAADP